MAAKVAGGPNMGVQLIVNELKWQDYKTFKHISPSTLNTWIDRPAQSHGGQMPCSAELKEVMSLVIQMEE